MIALYLGVALLSVSAVTMLATVMFFGVFEWGLVIALSIFIIIAIGSIDALVSEIFTLIYDKNIGNKNDKF